MHNEECCLVCLNLAIGCNFLDLKIGVRSQAMNGDNRLLVTDEPVEFQK